MSEPSPADTALGPIRLLDREEWRFHAACIGVSTNVFFADHRNSAKVKEAKAICGRCEVSAACLEAEMTFEGNLPAVMRAGIRGGLDAKERHALYRRRLRQKTDG